MTTTNLYLPFDIIEDAEIINLIKNNRCIQGKMKIMKEDMYYSLFESETIPNHWFMENYITIFKRKYCNSALFVFKTLSDTIGYDEENKVVYAYNKYYMIFNEKSVTNQDNRLRLSIVASSMGNLVFEDKETLNKFSIKILIK